MDLTLPGLLSPELYETSEFWKIHTDDFFSYFDEPLKSQMLAKNARTAEPRSGKIDYDQHGKLIGNWFKEGTNGYAGANQEERVYWSGHLAIFYDALDPERVVVSIGQFKDGQPGAYYVRDSRPDPATIGTDSGVVKYELIDTYGFTEEEEMRFTSLPVAGTILFQVLWNESLKVEAFVGIPADQVDGFTSEAVRYER